MRNGNVVVQISDSVCHLHLHYWFADLREVSLKAWSKNFPEANMGYQVRLRESALDDGITEEFAPEAINVSARHTQID